MGVTPKDDPLSYNTNLDVRNVAAQEIAVFPDRSEEISPSSWVSWSPGQCGRGGQRGRDRPRQDGGEVQASDEAAQANLH